MLGSTCLEANIRIHSGETKDIIETNERIIPSSQADNKDNAAGQQTAVAFGNIVDNSNMQNHTLKQTCINRWNSVLYMIDSILSLIVELNVSLKGNVDTKLCLMMTKSF
jgi:hypothetical protein